ncbi:uncharacterized protein Z520_05239 [Fonsecaea multimorphosa CBS 102226]|uniref:Uncharacterized protein n=1 Tax=Fonsecaea multimorphosa CBS 102226 TaxID=1442371 RepID=A0A0D2KPW8_9EURO|nr:uncharacterized protein Z520_05239 [Fonsecaea multimorphosa CBS 102226]KIX98778.1 hypothetical protein Z520_05239 [Fonsecaea multimorphosa CBS 102226]
MAEGFAFVTGGASGIGKGVAQMLVKHNIKVFIVDRDLEGAQKVVNELGPQMAKCAQVDVASWNSQAKAFSQAVADFGRIDYVYPIAGVGERPWIPNDPSMTGFEQPDLTVLDIDLTGVFYTVALAVQQFRKQQPGKDGFRGKIGCVASVCGFYCSPTLPVYTAAKHGVVGLVRSYGKYLPEEKITMNAVCPNVIRTNISSSTFYDQVEKAGLLVPIEGVIDTFEKLLGSDATSGEIFEIGPNYKDQGAVQRKGTEFLDKESEKTFELLYHRSKPLHQPR